MQRFNCDFYKKVINKIKKTMGDEIDIKTMEAYRRNGQMRVRTIVIDSSNIEMRLKELELIFNEDKISIYNTYGQKLA